MKINRILIGALLTAGIFAGFAGNAQAAAPAQSKSSASASTAPVHYRYVQVDNVNVFYREAGDPSAPTVLLLHGFPTSSFMYRDLIPMLADRYHVIAPDLPGFGFTQSPDRSQYKYTFDNLTQTIDKFTDALQLRKYAIQVFDYGAPVGWRLAVAHPERITAIISQNGNGYEEGLSDGWTPIQKYWKEPTEANRNALREFLKPDSIKWQYTHGAKDPGQVAPEAYTLDSAFISRRGNDDIQLDLFLDYASNVKFYPKLHAYFRKHQPPTLAVWGKNDPFFLPAGAEAFKRDNPKAQVHFYDAGHFALETNIKEIGAEIRRFLDQNVSRH